MDFRDVDKLTTAGSAAIKVVSFELPYSALSALRQLDRAFDVETTAETERAGYEFEAWRKLKVNRMELRFQFYTWGGCNLVSVYGLQAKTVPLVTSFKSDRAEECYYTHFLSRLALCVKDQFVAVAMGQNARLGGASLLHTLPEGLLRLLMQPVYAALEPWDEDQEVEFQTAIAMRELEETKALIRQLVASDEETEDVIVFKGEFQNLKYHMAGLCAKLDQRFGVFTDEVGRALKTLGFNGKRGQQVVLTGGGAQLPGLADYAQAALGRPVRIGSPPTMLGLPPAHATPSSSTLVGLMLYAAADPVDIRKFGPTWGPTQSYGGLGLLQRIWRAMKDYF
jgi:hypothetical protein